MPAGAGRDSRRRAKVGLFSRWNTTEHEVSESQLRRKDAPVVRQRWSTLAVATLGLLLVQPAVSLAAGFGQLRVQSSLGQPLQAEIDISGVSRDDADSLVVKLAPPEAYEKAGLPYLPAVGGMNLELERRPDGSYVARVRSNQPVSDLYVDILVDMSWASGKVTRAFTFLLDPAGTKQAAQPVSPRVIPAATPDAAPATPSTSAAPAPAAPVATPAARQAGPAGSASGAGNYTVRRGDSLSGIAVESMRGQAGVSLDQMLVALYRANPDAFVGGNMNRLKSGAVLRVPSPADAQAVARPDARREVVTHTQAFDEYRNRLASAAASLRPSEAGTREQSGAVTARVQEQAAPPDARDELKLSKPESTAQKDANTQAEATVARARELKEAESRLAQLEKNVGDMQRLVELKNAEIARMDRAGTTGAGGPVTGPAVRDAASAPSASEAAALAAGATAAGAAGATGAASAPSGSPTTPGEQPPAVVQGEPVPQSSFLSAFLSNPLTVIGALLLIVVLGAYALFRRRHAQDAQDAQDALQADQAAQSDREFRNSMAPPDTAAADADPQPGAAAAASAAAAQHSVFGTDFHIGSGVADSSDVDPIAEADVYIAYGRDAQAEEILREALQQEPERQAVRLKLLEIYNTRQDVEGFRVMAEEMLVQTGGQGAHWAQAAAMGRALEPENPLYRTEVPDGRPVSATLPTATAPHDLPLPARDEPSIGDFALPLDAFPVPAPGAPLTAPADAGRVFGDTVVGIPQSREGTPEADAGVDDLPLDTPTRARPMTFDMAGLSFDLDAPLQSANQHVEHAGHAETAAAAASIHPSGARDLQIKFDLAKAYLEIGDRNGARELLQEVVDQAADPLQDEARTLLRQVG